MKKMKRAGMMMVMVLLVLNACNNADEISVNTIEGTYLGTLSLSNGQKSSKVQADVSATAEVTKVGTGSIQVHCFGGAIDTTFMLNYYENHDSIMVCLTGNAFNQMYGHMMGQGHMTGGMMGDKKNGETDWMHHMSDEHMKGDAHFGGFDKNTNKFGYTFKMANGYMYFNGHKK